MATLMPRRWTAAKVLGTFLICALINRADVSHADDLNTTCAPSSHDGVAFKLISATAAPFSQSSAYARFVIAASNQTKGRIGVFIFTQQTSASFDTGVDIHDIFLKSSGIGACSYDTREACVRNKSQFMVTISPMSSASFSVQLDIANFMIPERKRLASLARLADFNSVIYLLRETPEASEPVSDFVALTFFGCMLRNSLH